MIARGGAMTPAPPAAAEGRGYDPAWFDVLAEVEERHFWFRARNRIIGTVAGELLPRLGRAPRLLEVGCGNGNVLELLRALCPDGSVVGMDLFSEGLRHAQRRCDCRLVAGNILEPPFADGSFDLIGMFDVLEHIEDDRRALRALHSLLAPSGAVLLTVPAGPALWSYFDEAGGHYRRYRRPDLLYKLAEAGFTVSYVTHFMLTLFPLMWVARRWAGSSARGAARAAPADPAQLALAELKVRPMVNEFLLRALRWERWWIERRRSLPAGTSLLAVARKTDAGSGVAGR